MLKRIVKRDLTDESGRALNPDRAFTRFGCNADSSKTLFAVFRALCAVGIVLSSLWDYGILDSPAHAVRKPRDGDRVPFLFRPQTWLMFFVLAYLVQCIRAADFDRNPAQAASHLRAYLFIWNARVVIMPLVPATFITYFDSKGNASFDPAYEATLVFMFLVCCAELLIGAWPAEWIDMVLPLFVAVVFLVYILIAHAASGVVYFAQLDWRTDPGKAALNGFLFFLIVLSSALLVTLLAKLRNRRLGLYIPPSADYGALNTVEMTT